jgi:ribosomal protein S18 acetylase RimI-like enzyme
MFGEKRVGLITYRVDGDGCEIITLNSLMERIGIGTALVKAVQSKAASSNWRRLWLITTNDNLQALSFYQRRGFSLAALHRNAVDLSRKLKPEIPQIGFNGIPIRDELELEMLL